jgi:hypothetical protein
MHEGGAVSWREVVDRYHSALAEEISVRLDSEVKDAADRAVAAALAEAGVKAGAELKRACEEARRAQVESLNQFLRRLRTTAEGRVLDLLAEGCASYAGKLVVLVFESNQARSAAGAGLTERGMGLSFDIQAAPAIISSIESRDPMVALATAAEISPVLAEVLGPAADGKAYLFPVVARQSVVAMLVASEVGSSAPIELRCEATGMRFETGAAGAAPENSAPESSAPRGWEDLSVEERKLHLQAQRTARVRVAEMRLYHENELRQGTAVSDIYSALKKEIDAARDQFLQTYLAKSATMVDYLHLEILRSLADDDDRLLGHNYPGPMV